MKNLAVKFLQTALDDLEEIVLYIAQDSPQSAVRLHDRVIARANELSNFPMIGMAVPDEKISQRGFRMIGVGGYILFYKVFEDKVVVLRVLHGKRDYPHLLIDMPTEDEIE
jgi:addiction module RelE/StbE family toxin